MRMLKHFFMLFSFALALLVIVSFLGATKAEAQATLSAGNIQGTIQDPNGGVVATAEVTVSSKATGQKLKPEVNSNGFYSTPSISPGLYTVRVEAKGFKVTELEVTVQVGMISSGSVTLQVGSEATIITVESSAVTVNTDQVTVQGVLTSDQIKNLPINGRNFLDLAQLEPGVQIQDGGNFDPTKNGFSSISFGGRYGRTARIEVDGLDISDETVGTTTQNVPLIAIKEFQVGQSTLDLSTELTSSGAVNISTNTGTNALHGQGFFNWRGDSVSAKLSPDSATPFDRKQYGFGIGGPFVKDRLFFYGGWERTVQALQAAVALTEPFHDLHGSFASPFFDNEFIGRVDYRFARGWSLFYRYSFEQNRNVSTYAPNTFQPFANVDHTPSHAVGFDFTTGKFAHSIRFGYMKFRNNIADAVAGSSIFNPAPEIELAIGGDPFCLTAGADQFCSGPNFLAPQATFQKNTQFKYDGSFVMHSHQIRYGFGVNRINGGGFATFLGLGPATNSALTEETELFADGGPFPGGHNNPLNYPVQAVYMGNGQGFFTEKKAFNLPGGGQNDTRFQWYVGDAWKARPNLTLTAGLRYVRDTGRADSDMAAIPCSATTLISCSGNLMDLWGAGLGAAVRQPNKNYGGNVGIAWDPFHNGKTVIRAGAGIYYENAPFNNVLFDRPARLQSGLFWGYAQACPGTSVTFPDGSIHDTSEICGQPIGSVASALGELQKEYQQAVLAAGPGSNGAFVGNTLAEGPNSTGDQLIAPVYRTPFSEQMNIGIQRELRKGTVLEVNYVRNVGLHSLLAHDLNYVGDSRYLNLDAAANAIAATNAAFSGCADVTCAINHGATIVDYASNGLDSGNAYLFGLPASIFGLTPDSGAAFPGANPNIGQNNMLFPEGHSVYNALQMSLRSDLDKPLSGVKHANLTVSYSLSRYRANAADSDFINNSVDNRNPNAYFGPNGLDRTHQLSAGGYFDLPLWTRMTFITHWYSALPATLAIQPTNGPGDIFVTDVTGDGTTGDVLPGTNLGAFDRSVKVGNLNKVISNFNSTYAGTLTPAGQALVDAGMMTADQLAALGATIQPIALAPAKQVGLDAFFTFDLTLGWNFKPIKRWESVSFQPQIAFYNLFNRQNFDSPRSPMSGTLNGQAGSANGTTYGDRANLIGLGSGVFALGAPRSLEFGFRVYF